MTSQNEEQKTLVETNPLPFSLPDADIEKQIQWMYDQMDQMLPIPKSASQRRQQMLRCLIDGPEMLQKEIPSIQTIYDQILRQQMISEQQQKQAQQITMLDDQRQFLGHDLFNELMMDQEEDIEMDPRDLEIEKELISIQNENERFERRDRERLSAARQQHQLDQMTSRRFRDYQFLKLQDEKDFGYEVRKTFKQINEIEAEVNQRIKIFTDELDEASSMGELILAQPTDQEKIDAETERIKAQVDIFLKDIQQEISKQNELQKKSYLENLQKEKEISQKRSQLKQTMLNYNDMMQRNEEMKYAVKQQMQWKKDHSTQNYEVWFQETLKATQK